MSNIYNIYCDESCHLEHDRHQFMVLGAVYCEQKMARVIAEELRKIKGSHHIGPTFEVKWSKVSAGGLALYKDVIKYFFSNRHLRFRGLIADKSVLNHEAYNQSHDEWYHKMYYCALKAIINDGDKYRAYIDIQNTHSPQSFRTLHDCLSGSMHDYDHMVLERVQPVRSEEIEQLQIADLLIGAIGYANRGFFGNSAKTELVDLVKEYSDCDLMESTSLFASKFNLFRWDPRHD